jgi:hypothetical protein
MADDKITTLFVSTTSRILKLGLSKKGQGLPPKTVEDTGCDLGCMARDPSTGEVVVAREDAIYTYRMDGRGPPKAYEGPKKMIAVYGDYIAVARPPSALNDKEPDSMRRRFGSNADGLFDSSSFVLLEPDLRIIAHTETLISPVKFIFSVWGDIFTVSEQGKVSFRVFANCTNKANDLDRYIDTMKRRFNNALNCFTNGACSPLRWSLLVTLISMPNSKASYTGGMVITSIKRPITMEQWCSTFGPLTPLSRRKSFERFGRRIK